MFFKMLFRLSQKFCNFWMCASLQRVYEVAEEIQSIIVGALKHWALLHTTGDLKAAQMKGRR